MFNVKHQYIVLEIPKNGSRSLIKAASEQQGKQWMKCQGHHSFAEIVDDLIPTQAAEGRIPTSPVRTYVVIRNPLNRLLSQVNHYIRNKAGVGLDAAMHTAWEQSDIVFKPQSHFLSPSRGQVEADLRMWDMERIEDAMSHMVGAKVAYHKNKASNYQVTMEQILDHRLFSDLSNTHYDQDFKLWLQACRTDEEGKQR